MDSASRGPSCSINPRIPLTRIGRLFPPKHAPSFPPRPASYRIFLPPCPGQALDQKSFPITDAETFIFTQSQSESSVEKEAEEPPVKKRKKEKKEKKEKTKGKKSAASETTITPSTVLEWDESSHIDQAVAVVESEGGDGGLTLVRVQLAMVNQLRERIARINKE